MSKGELHTNCFKNRYTLQASTFQMAVLLAYNGSTSWTIQQLQYATQIKMDFLLQVIQHNSRSNITTQQHNNTKICFIQVVQILLKAKLLTAVSDDVAELTPLSTVELFTGYKKYIPFISIIAYIYI